MIKIDDVEMTEEEYRVKWSQDNEAYVARHKRAMGRDQMAAANESDVLRDLEKQAECEATQVAVREQRELDGDDDRHMYDGTQ